MKCNKCSYELKEILGSKSLTSMGFKKRTNYPFGRNSRGITTYFCVCGGIFVESQGEKSKW